MAPSTLVRLLAISGCAAAMATFQPASVPFSDLTAAGVLSDEARATLVAALSEVGVVTISDIPGYGELRERVLRDAHRCVRASPEALSHVFEDGTVRTTLAGIKDAAGAHEINVGEDADAACTAFKESSRKFRDLVTRVSEAFGRHLGALLGLAGSAPLLRTADSERSYGSVTDIFHHGQHLEHFHSYRQPEREEQANVDTVDLHTDQGLCIAFTAALLVEEGAEEVLATHKHAGQFQIELLSGERVPVSFPAGHLVFMLGDGVNQYVNARAGLRLRAVPHAMAMPKHEKAEARVWYGRMFLPPRDAVSEEHGMTHGSIRDLMTEAFVSNHSAASSWKLALGCSGGQRAVRELSAPAGDGHTDNNCASNQMYCWFRCMNYTADASPNFCAAEGSQLQCTNPRDEYSNGMHHGDYAPRCSNTTQYVRHSCELDLINAGRTSCSASGFESYISAQTSGLNGRWDLQLDAAGAPAVVLKWTVTNNKKVRAAMLFNGKTSWMALGITNPGGKHNGMYGASVVMGISTSDTEYGGNVGVNEYRISSVSSPFYTWNQALDPPAVTDSSFEDSGCYTQMRFTTDTIYGQALNLTTNNDLIWSIRASSYMQIGKSSYHEGCVNGELVRMRGGGTKTPWIVNFSDMSHHTVKTSTANITNTSVETNAGWLTQYSPVVLLLMLIVQVV